MAAALKTRTIKSKAKAARKTGQKRQHSGFQVRGHREIEEKREEIRSRIEPGQRLYGARGYRGIARELQLLISNDQDNSLTRIAADSGVTMPTLKRLWAGQTKKPSFDTVEKIMSTYGLDIGSARRFTVVSK